MSPRARLGPRISRVLAMLPYINEHQGVTIDELVQRFAVDADELRRDLELLPMCGLPPYTPDRLISLDISEDGDVSLEFAEYFERPPSIAASDGLAVLAAGTALLAVPGADPDGALASALTKLADVLPQEGVSLEIETPEALGELRAAMLDSETVEIDYYSLGRDEESTRRVDPGRIWLHGGHWYVEAWCHNVEDRRNFRVDRIRALRRTGEHFATHSDAEAETTSEPDPVPYAPGPDDTVVELRLAPNATWVVESAAVDAIEVVRVNQDGSQVVRFPVSNQVFLERLLLRLGGHATVLQPTRWADLTEVTAQRVLSRYAS